MTAFGVMVTMVRVERIRGRARSGLGAAGGAATVCGEAASGDSDAVGAGDVEAALDVEEDGFVFTAEAVGVWDV